MNNQLTIIASREITFPSKKAVVIDPCYSSLTDGIVIDNCEALYAASVVVSNEGAWGNRVKALLLTAYEFANKVDSPEELYARILSEGEIVESIGVDSGQAGIFDCAMFPLGGKEWDKDSVLPGDKFYTECCEATCDSMFGKVLNGHGIVSSSGFGDGGYEVRVVKNKNNLVKAIMIDFIPDENESEYEDDYEEEYDDGYAPSDMDFNQ